MIFWTRIMHEGLTFKTGNFLTSKENFENLSHYYGHRIWKPLLWLNEIVAIIFIPPPPNSINSPNQIGKIEKKNQFFNVICKILVEAT